MTTRAGGPNAPKPEPTKGIRRGVAGFGRWAESQRRQLQRGGMTRQDAISQVRDMKADVRARKERGMAGNTARFVESKQNGLSPAHVRPGFEKPGRRVGRNPDPGTPRKVGPQRPTPGQGFPAPKVPRPAPKTPAPRPPLDRGTKGPNPPGRGGFTTRFPGKLVNRKAQ